MPSGKGHDEPAGIGVQDYRKLRVWKQAHDLTLAIYRVTSSFPREESYGLTSQLRRASASVPANIAEGCARGSRNEFARFLQIAAGSASELDYHLLLAKELGFLLPADYDDLNAELLDVRKMLTAFLRKLRTND